MQFDLGHINKITVVNVNLTGKSPVFNFVTLKQKKEQIDFIKTQENIANVADVVKAATNKYPLLLHFTGKGILNRKVKNTPNYRHGILMNANLNNFYFTDYLANETVFSSVIRKDVVEEVIAEFTTEKCQVISISSGPFVAAFLNNILHKKTLHVNNFNLHFEADHLIDFDKTTPEEHTVNSSIQLGDERIRNSLVTSVAMGAAFFNPTESILLPEDETIFSANKEEAKQKNIFTRFGMGMMLFFLVALFANYLYLGHLNQVIVDNSIYLEEYQDQLGEISQLEDECNRKEKLLQSSGLLNRNFLSFYLMELGNSIPSEITFDEITIRPLKKEIKQRKKIEFKEHIILLNGRSTTSHILSNWIAEIEEFDWLTKVDILDYSYVKNEGVFELEMIVL